LPTGIGLNLGCGPIMLKNVNGVDFTNIDHDKIYLEYAEKEGAIIDLWDLNEGLPPDIVAADESISFVNMSQFLEHLNLSSAERLLEDCYNVMESGGIIRISVPDLELLLFHLKINKMDKFENEQPKQWYNKYNSQSMKFALILFGSLHEDGESGHKMCYDFQSLKELLEKYGFRKIKRVGYDSRYDAEVGESHQLCCEAIKP
jgi:predicted SAM-dependent methyltransferase